MRWRQWHQTHHNPSTRAQLKTTVVWAWLRTPHHQPSQLEDPWCLPACTRNTTKKPPHNQDPTCAHSECTLSSSFTLIDSFSHSFLFFLCFSPSMGLLKCTLIREIYWQNFYECFRPGACEIISTSISKLLQKCHQHSLPEGCGEYLEDAVDTRWGLLCFRLRRW